jgi:hypothetical protein
MGLQTPVSAGVGGPGAGSKAPVPRRASVHGAKQWPQVRQGSGGLLCALRRTSLLHALPTWQQGAIAAAGVTDTDTPCSFPCVLSGSLCFPEEEHLVLTTALRSLSSSVVDAPCPPLVPCICRRSTSC